MSMKELAGLPGDYAAPHGRLLLVLNGKRAAGCLALRKFGDYGEAASREFAARAFDEDHNTPM